MLEQSHAQEIADKAKKAIAATDKKVPASLTDIPATVAQKLDDVEAAREMSPNQLAAMYDGKTHEQINAIMAKLV